MSTRATGTTSTPKAEARPQQQPTPEEPEKDIVTGRVLSDAGRSCLRCVDKGLRCTLLYAGQEGAVQCAACRRSGAHPCVRQVLADVRQLERIRRRIEREMINRHNNNGSSKKSSEADDAYRVEDSSFDVGAALARWQAVLDEHYAEATTYVGGVLVQAQEARAMALPSFQREGQRRSQ